MTLTPEEIADKEFLVSLRGYDKTEVRSFLQIGADAFRDARAAEEPAAGPPAGEPAAEEPAAALPAAEPVTTAPPPARVAPLAPSERPAAASAGTDRANLGEEIAAVLRTAHEQAERLRAQAAEESAAARAEAEAWAETARAAGEQDRTEAASRLAAAQDEGLALVADAQARADKMMETTKVRARQQAEASVAHLVAQIEELTAVRNRTRSQLGELRTRLDAAISEADAPRPPSTPNPRRTKRLLARSLSSEHAAEACVDRTNLRVTICSRRL
jgi:DivIVA domain-containing protein